MKQGWAVESTTHWILEIGAGNRDAATELWNRYYDRLVRFARQRLSTAPRAAADEEDVALSAFNCFYQAIEEGRLRELQDSESFWRLLITITAHKAISRIRHERCDCRDYRRIDGAASKLLEGNESNELDPDFVVETIDTCREWLERLGDGSLRLVAIRRLEGYSNPDIARELNCSIKTVERKLNLIRQHLLAEPA